MAENRKVSQNPSIGEFFGNNLLLVVDQSDGIGTTKKQTLSDFFSTIETDVVITGDFSVSGNTSFYGPTTFGSTVEFTDTANINNLSAANGIIFRSTFTPGSNTGIGIPTGKVFFDSNYLYVKVSNNVVKRVSLSSF